MKIWMIGRSYPTKQNNMMGSFELEQAKMLAHLGNDVAYIAAVFHPYKKIKKWGFVSFKNDNIDIFAVSIPFLPGRIHIHFEMFQKFFWRKLLQKTMELWGEPDIIHVQYPALATIAEPIIAYQEKGARIVVTEHWTKVLNNSLDAFQRKQLLQYVEYADAFLCVGGPLRDAIRTISGTEREITIVPNVVSPLFVPKEKTKQNRFEFIAVGRLVPVKQMDKIVEAFSAVFKGNKNVRLTIVGDGPEKRAVQTAIEKNKVRDQVEMTGTLSRQETAQRVAAADSLVCYSNFETFGVPIVEAWMCGIPTTTTTAAVVIDRFDQRLGVEVEPNDLEGLKRAMLHIYEHIDEYDRGFISQFAKERFSEEAVYEMLMKVYAVA